MIAAGARAPGIGPDVVATLAESARFVRTWGQSRLADGRTVADVLTLDGIPFWDALAVDLARVYLLPTLSAPACPSWMVRRVRPYLSRAKHRVREARRRRGSDACASWPAGGAILCLGFSDYIYRDVLQPVVESLSSDPRGATVSVSDQPWGAAATSDRRFQTIWRHWEPAMGRECAVLRQQLGRAAAVLGRRDGLQGIVESGRSPAWHSVEHVFRWLFLVHIPRLIPYAVVARHMLRTHRPTLVISPDVADPRTRLYTLLCPRLGLPSLEIQVGPMAAECIEWRFLAADRVAVWGEASRTMLRRHGVPDDRMVVTGSPRHDALVSRPGGDVRSTRAALGVPDDAAMVLFASTYHFSAHDAHSAPELLRAMKRAVFEAADRTTGVCLVVKPHPLEDTAETRALAGNCRHVVFADRQRDIRELTRVCDAFVSFGSTATADALIARKTTICPAFPGWMWNDIFIDTGATMTPRSVDEIQQAFQAVGSGADGPLNAGLEPARQRFIEQWVFRADGSAAERVKALALQMAQGKMWAPGPQHLPVPARLNCSEA